MQQSQDPSPEQLPAITPAPVLEAQPHGGALRRGNRGNKGGMGRVPSRVRLEARKTFWELIPELRKIARGEHIEQTAVVSQGKDAGSEIEFFDGPAKPSDRIKAAAVLAQVGMGENISAEDVRSRLVAQVAIIREELGPELGEQLIARLSKVWK